MNSSISFGETIMLWRTMLIYKEFTGTQQFAIPPSPKTEPKVQNLEVYVKIQLKSALTALHLFCIVVLFQQSTFSNP
jgi:hypothetical protein